MREKAHLFVAADACLYALHFGVADVSELKLRHGHHLVILRHELPTAPHKLTVVLHKSLQYLTTNNTYT